MTEQESTQCRNLKLEKLGIRQIQERIEVSPILTDPGTTGEVPTPKQYVCTINYNDPGGKFDLR